MKAKHVLFLGILVMIFIVSTTSCKKPKPPKATVTVTNVSGVHLANAIVKVYSDPNHVNDQGNVGYVDPVDTVLTYVAATDGSGQASFEFKYEAIYNVLAKYVADGSSDTLKGTGVLILENDKTYEETVIVR